MERIIKTENNEMIEKITDILKSTVNGKCGIALAGAHAKGTADTQSDLDFFMFLENPKSYEERLQVIQSSADRGTSPWVSYDFESEPWGGTMDFQFEGTPVETTVRTLSLMERRLSECLEGKFEILPATWTSNGYYTFTFLCELSFLRPVWDPYGIIASYQKKAKYYPEKLKASVIRCFYNRANTWLDSFHYQSAIERKDLLFTSPIVLHTVLDIIQVIFACNETYFTGDKKLEAALAKLPYCPKLLTDNIEFLLSSPRDTGLLEKQKVILKSIRDELSEKIRPIL